MHGKSDQRADLMHCGKKPNIREEFNGSLSKWRIESRHAIESLDGIRSRSHHLRAQLRMLSLTVDCDTFK